MLAVIAMVAHNHYAVRMLRDLGSDDEGWYLGSGVLLGKPGFPNGPNGWPIPEQGPMYSLWYWALSKIWSAPLDLYYASWQLLTLALALALLVVVRRAGAPWWQALLATFFYVNSAVADIWPFPTYFATLLVMLGVLHAARTRTTSALLSSVTVALACAAFARPELLSAYAAAVLVVCVHSAREIRSAGAGAGAGARARVFRDGAIRVGIAVAPGALLFAAFGNPLGGMRSFYAFAQHYTINLFVAEGSPLNPWAHWGEIVARDFPGTWTLGQVIRSNPSAFFAHVLRNVQTFPKAFLMITDSLDASRGVQVVIVAIGSVFAVIQLLRSRAIAKSRAVTRALFFAFACCAVPFVLSCLVIYPREHYFVPVAVLVVALVFTSPLPLAAMVAWRPSRAMSGTLFGVFAALLVVLTAPKSPDKSLDRQRTVLFLESLHLREGSVVMEESWGTCMYAGLTCTTRLRYEKLVPFDAFVNSFDIDVLVMDETLSRDPHFQGDPEFEDFLREPAKHGFAILDVPNTHVKIARRQ